jgi:hypothetical protein
MGDVQGPEKVNDTCAETMHMGTIDRGFTVALVTSFVFEKTRVVQDSRCIAMLVQQ